MYHSSHCQLSAVKHSFEEQLSEQTHIHTDCDPPHSTLCCLPCQMLLHSARLSLSLEARPCTVQLFVLSPTFCSTQAVQDGLGGLNGWGGVIILQPLLTYYTGLGKSGTKAHQGGGFEQSLLARYSSGEWLACVRCTCELSGGENPGWCPHSVYSATKVANFVSSLSSLCHFSHNQRTTTFRHPVTGQISPENLDFILQEQWVIEFVTSLQPRQYLIKKGS